MSHVGFIYRICQSASCLKLSPCFSYSLKLLSALKAILKDVEQTNLSIKMGQIICSSVLSCSFCCYFTFCLFYWFSLYILYKWKKFKQMGQNVHFHTDTSVLLLKFRHKLTAGKCTRNSWNDLQRIQINSADKTAWKKLISTSF